jgi:8-oxo-dGTP diphosphatase
MVLFHRDDKETIVDPDCWDLIGGHADPGETPEQTLIREVKEEIGVAIENPTHVARFVDHWGAYTDLYIVQLTDDQTKNLKHGEEEGQGIELFTLDEIKGLKLTRNMKKYMIDYQETLKKHLS